MANKKVDKIKESTKVDDIMKEIRDSKPIGASRKDEVRFMKAMLNDDEFVSSVYGTVGGEYKKVSEFSPYKASREILANFISSATKMNKNEAKDIAENYTFSNNDATNMIGISKEFINSYTDTGRKLNLGKRETYDASLYKVEVERRERTFPSKTVDAKGNVEYKPVNCVIPKHTALRVKVKIPPTLK